ncbi:MAG: agmatinase [Candidatus Bathyarchaeia archaeon]
MSSFELHVSHTPVFGGCQKPFEKADYVVFGVPFDLTSTFRTGARFAPTAIREASLNLETYSFRTNRDVEDLKIHDAGDLHISNNIGTLTKRLEDVVRDLQEAEKTPAIIGGEHTVTLGAMQGIGGKDAAVISFDAHLDLRDRYMDLTTSHTTFMRRLNETVKPERIVEIGTRAVCKEELAYARKMGIQYYTAKEILDKGVEAATKAVKKTVEGCRRVYLTIDMDVLDPAFAPAVQNPEPDGISTQTLLGFICNLCDNRTVGMDLVEVTPPYDQGNTAVHAAKILFETLCAVEKAREG